MKVLYFIYLLIYTSFHFIRPRHALKRFQEILKERERYISSHDRTFEHKEGDMSSLGHSQ